MGTLALTAFPKNPIKGPNPTDGQCRHRHPYNRRPHRQQPPHEVMFVLFGKKKADVIDHWYALIPSLSNSTKESYTSVENELKERQVTGLEMSRVDFSEGGLLPQKREYLRIARVRSCLVPFIHLSPTVVCPIAFRMRCVTICSPSLSRD